VGAISAGLAATHVALKESDHRPRRGHVFQDVGHASRLGRGQGERQRSAERGESGTVDDVTDARFLAVPARANAEHADFDAQEFLIGEPVSGGAGRIEAVREMHRLQGLGRGRIPVPTAEVFWQRFGRVTAERIECSEHPAP